MHLKSLVLKGFKSFADRSVLSFEPGIAAIVGPNGSGKSNISDAVLWVLGERSARNLRGQAMEDVIFSGSSARKPVSVAEVSLVLDNSCSTLPLDYSEVVLTRRMYRSGESEYLINNSQARRMDILDILHDSGLGTNTHSIISQGHLSSILQSKPEDRRALIEEAAGVLKHKQRKEKSQRKLELMDNHLARVQDVVAEVQRQVKPLERKAKRALAYEDAAAQLAKLKLDLAVDDLRRLQGEWDAVLAREGEAQQAVAALRQDIDGREQAAAGLQERLQAGVAAAGEAAGRYRRAQGALDKLDANAALFHEKKRNAAGYLAEMQIALENDARAAEAAQAQQLAAQEQLEEAQQAAYRARAAQEEAQKQADAARVQQRSLQKEIDRLSHQRRDTMKQLEESRGVLARTQEQLASNRAQSQMMESHAQDLAGRLKAAKQASRAAEEQLQQARLDIENAKDRQAAQRALTGAALQERDAARAKADAARSALATCSAQVKSQEELLRARRAGNPLLGWTLSNEGELAALAEKISAPAKLYPVVEQLLGQDIQALFVKDRAAAIRIARRLAARSEAGSVTFLAQDAGAAVQRQRPARYLIDELGYEAEYAGAIRALLGDVLLFEDAEGALDFARENPGLTCASIDGFIVWANGKLSCRHRGEGESSELALHKDLEDARADLKKAQEQLDAAQAGAQAAEEQLREAQAADLELSQGLAQLKGSLKAAEGESDRSRQAQRALENEQLRLERNQRQISAALAEAEPGAVSLQAQVQQLAQSLAACTEELDAKRGELAPVRALADAATAGLSEAKLASATAANRLAYAQRMLQACQRDIDKSSRQMQRARAGIAKKKAALLRIDPIIDVLNRLAECARRCTLALESESSSSQSATEGLQASINEARSAIRAAQQNYDARAAALADIRVQKSRIEMQVQAALDCIEQDLDTPLETALQLPVLENRPQAEEQAAKLDKRIANMGVINPEAASEYQQLKQRFDYLNAQLEDMKAARSSLRKILRAIDNRMKDDFANTFDAVNANFKQIFGELFPGGAAQLSLTDPEDMENTGVEVNAQPSGKRVLKMSLLSGGEKSLTALALLFAVYKTRATPFYVLDEVEAALDDTNLRRLLAYLNGMRHNSQFIIITHQRRTMEMADVLYGVSMQSDGVSKVLSQRLDKALQYAEG